MYKIEFNDEMTVDGILESFKNLKDADVNAYIDIDCSIIYHDDDNLEEKIRKAYTKYHEKHSIDTKSVVKKEETKNMETEKMQKKLIDLITLSNDEKFLFELGNVVEYTKEEYRKAVIDFYVKVYGVTSKDEDDADFKNLEYKSNLLLILASDEDKLQKRLQIQQLINTMCINKNEELKFRETVRQIDIETSFGDELKELLHTNILEKSIEDANKTLKRIKNKKQF